MPQKPNQVVCVCKHCGKSFSTKASNLNYKGRGQYCSKQCFNIVQTKRKTFNCPVCGKQFEKSLASIPTHGITCCSTKCAGIHNRTRETVSCQYCGKSFETKRSRVVTDRAKYCSRECCANAKTGDRSRFWRGGNGCNRGANWGKQKRAAYKRDGGVCQICHRKNKPKERKFGIHHITPYRLFNGDYLKANELSNLITLCPKCHKQVEIGNLATPVHLF